jgi:ABC-type transport system substrate-binding protein
MLLGAFVVLLATACTPPGLPEPIAPSGPTSLPSSPPPAGTVVIGLDGLAGRITGFNPYSIADFSLASQAATSLVLPSAFLVGADGRPAADPDVIDDATVTSEEPFTVTYTLDRKASWSDGTPITAEDFSYLRDQLLVQPGTIGSAGYRLITAITSRDAGKTVQVQFAASYPDWQTLFSPLLPSHLMKDSPGGWTGALDNDIPITGNRYRMTSYDPVTGQVNLARNDKYWGAQPGPVAVALRLGDPADLLAAFIRGDVQALWLAPNTTLASSLEAAVPADRRTVVPIPESTQLVFNTTAGVTAEPAIRTAIAAGMDLAVVAQDLTAGWPTGGATVTSQVTLPAQTPADGAQPTPPITTDDQSAAVELLTSAGYTRDGLYATKEGEVLRLTLGYPSGDLRLAAVARTMQAELGSVGIEVDLLADTASNLIETRMATGTFDLALVRLPRGYANPTSAASAFGCSPDDVLGVGSTVTEALAGQGSPDTTGAATVTAAPGAAAAPVPRTGNLSGYCAAGTQQDLVDALTGQGSTAFADPTLWADLPVLPLQQQSAVFAVSESLRTVLAGDQRGWMWTGPLIGMSGWPTTG